MQKIVLLQWGTKRSICMIQSKVGLDNHIINKIVIMDNDHIINLEENTHCKFISAI